jgi:hypothetical protein
VLATLARAMRCTTEDLGHAAERLTEILDEGAWSPAALATHLVDFVMGGVMLTGSCPADSLGWRLDRLPRSVADCACRSCRSWQHRPAAKQGVASARSVASGAPDPVAAAVTPIAPELAAIERAAAAGAAQARLAAATA